MAGGVPWFAFWVSDSLFSKSRELAMRTTVYWLLVINLFLIVLMILDLREFGLEDED